MRILLFHKGGIGDVVFGLPLIADLRRAFPDAEFCALTHDQGRDILSHCPSVDRVFGCGPLGARWRVAKVLEQIGTGYDVALTTTRSPRAGWVLLKSGAQIRVGFDTGLEKWFFTHRAPGDFEVVFSRRFQRLAAALGLRPGTETAPLVVSKEERSAARARLVEQGWNGARPLVGIQLGGGWETKNWPVEHIEALANRLSAGGEQVLILGGAAQRDEARRVAQRVNALTTAGNSVSEALAELALCSALVGIDSGLSHAAAALGIPVLHLFGPTNPSSMVPSERQMGLSLGLPCQPCNRRARRRCPLGHHACMRDLGPDRVAAALGALRSRPAPRAHGS